MLTEVLVHGQTTGSKHTSTHFTITREDASGCVSHLVPVEIRLDMASLF